MVAAIIIFVLIIAGMFVFAFLKKSEIEVTVPAPTATPQTGPYDHITRIDAKHFFIDGVHTLVGETMLPTRCDLLDWSTSVAESMPEQVTIAFTVINNEPSCESGETPARFVATLTASEQAEFRATFMGRDVILNLIPPAPGETPDQFDLYSKG